MKKNDVPPIDTLRPEYRRDDLGSGVRGKHFDDYQIGTNMALLAPDIRAAFPTDEAVNNALRSLLPKNRKTN